MPGLLQKHRHAEWRKLLWVFKDHSRQPILKIRSQEYLAINFFRKELSYFLWFWSQIRLWMEKWIKRNRKDFPQRQLALQRFPHYQRYPNARPRIRVLRSGKNGDSIKADRKFLHKFRLKTLRTCWQQAQKLYNKHLSKSIVRKKGESPISNSRKLSEC